MLRLASATRPTFPAPSQRCGPQGAPRLPWYEIRIQNGMKPIASAWIAAASAFLGLGLLQAESRPRYGGAIHIEATAALNNLDPAEIPTEPMALDAKVRLIPMVF